MTHDPIAAYLDALAAALRSRHAYDPRIVAEARDHLIDAVDAGVRDGLSAEDAARRAIARFGDVERVAAAFIATRSPAIEGLLALACAGTLAATGMLSASLLILRPPRADYRTWTLEAFLFVAQAAFTLFVIFRGASPKVRALLATGGFALAVFGLIVVVAAFGRAHFEGFALLLGSIVTLQGLLTLLYVVDLRRLPRIDPA